MLTLDAGYTTHLAGETTALARLWKITRADSTVCRFTDHDRDLVIAGDGTYIAAGYNASAAKSSVGLSTDNLDIVSVFDSGSITEADLAAGLWDSAMVEISECVWSDLSLAPRVIKTGWLGQVAYDGFSFRAEFLGLASKLVGNIGRVVSPACDAILGDARCGVSLSAYTHAVEVTAVTSRAQFDDDALAGSSTPEGYFDNGIITWDTGANAGRSMEIKQFGSGGEFTLYLPMVDAIAVGDTGTAVAGCDKTLPTCRDQFANTVNFRGFPSVPGNDKLLAPKT
jgi:uncharacterized phage protein (TIGR02218 family)